MKRQFSDRGVGWPHKQRGVTTIAVGLIVLLLLTVAALYATRVGVMEQRVSANHYRHNEAFSAAEAGLDYGFAAIRQDRTWGDGGPYDSTTDDLSNGASFQVRKTITGAGFIEIKSRGVNPDGTGNVVVSKLIGGYPLMSGGPKVPLMAAGAVSAGTGSGNCNIVTSPNAAGEGVYLSAWTRDEVDFESGASGATCHQESMLANEVSEAAFRAVEAQAAGDGSHSYGGTAKYPVYWDDNGNFLVGCASCVCPATDSISTSGDENEDILDSDPNFPPDLFEYIFGVANSDYMEIKVEATQLADCSALDADSSGLYWVNGDCDIASNQVIGSFARPVMVVIDGSLDVNAGARIFGFLFAWVEGTAGGAPADGRDVTLNGGPVIYGGVIVNYDVEKFNGNYTIYFTDQLAGNLANNPDMQGLGVIPGSWIDINTWP